MVERMDILFTEVIASWQSRAKPIITSLLEVSFYPGVQLIHTALSNAVLLYRSPLWLAVISQQRRYPT